MKKFNLLAATVAVALSAAAQTGSFSPGGYWNNLPSPTSGSYMFPVDLSEPVSATQSIFSISELPAEWAPGIDADGVKSTSIKSLSFPISIEGGYVVDGEATIKVYLENYDDVTFPKVSNDVQWAPYGNGVSATVTLNADNAELAAVWESYQGNYVVTAEFDGLNYTGGSLLMTVVCENELFDGYYMDMTYGGYDYNPDQTISRTRSVYGRTSNLTGKPQTTAAVLPVVNFGYEISHEALPVVGPEKGEPRDIKIGTYDSPSTGSETVGAILPFDARYSHAYAQAVYSPELLSAMVGVEDGGTLTSEIEKLTYKMYFPYGMYSGSFTATVYVQPFDGTALPMKDGKSQWVAISDDAASGKVTSEEYDYTEIYDEEVEFEVSLSKPLEYTGGSLLVTWVTDTELEDLYEGFPLGCVFAGQGKVSAVQSGYSSLNGLTGNANNVGSDLPVLKLHVTPVITRGGETPAVITSATPVLKDNGSANIIALNITVDDTDASAEYVLTVDGKEAGKTTEKDFTVSYLDVPKKGVLLQLGKVGSTLPASSFTVSVDEILALFPAITVEPGDCALHAADYKLHEDTKATFSAVAEFTVNAGDIKAAIIKGQPKDSQCRVVASNTSMPDSFDSFLPTGEYNNYATTGGRISFYHPSFTTAPITDGVAELPADKKMDVAFSMEYPVAYKAVPSLTENNDALLKSSYTVDYENGSTWSYDKGVCSNNVHATEANTTFDPTYPYKLECRVNDAEGTIIFFAPKGHTIHYIFIPADAPLRAAVAYATDSDWISAEGGIWKTQLQPGELYVKTVNDATGEDVHSLSYIVDPDGVVTSLKVITADGSADATIYNLSGVAVGTELDKLPAGIYIQSGVKILKK